MANITAKMVAELRAKTGAGMMDCKKALTETDGDMDQAIDLLRKKGLSAAAKKAGRVAAEGLVTAVSEGNRCAVVEVNSETDFVAKNDAFRGFVDGVAKTVLEEAPTTMDDLMRLPFPATGRTVAEEQTHQIATIGENISIRRFKRTEVSAGVVASYVHGNGKIGVSVALATHSPDEKVAAVARQIAMHVAAANPQYLDRAQVPAAVIEKEKEIMRAKALDSGKPEKIIDKIIEGQINKFFGEVCLLEQIYVIDTDKKVAQVVQDLAREIGGDVELTDFVRYQLGEGIEKREDDFAAEVASMTS